MVIETVVDQIPDKMKEPTTSHFALIVLQILSPSSCKAKFLRTGHDCTLKNAFDHCNLGGIGVLKVMDGIKRTYGEMALESNADFQCQINQLLHRLFF